MNLLDLLIAIPAIGFIVALLIPRVMENAIRMIALRGQSADHPVLLAMPETEYLHFALLEIL